MTLSPSERIRQFRMHGEKTYQEHAFLRFLVAGGVNTVFGYSVFCLALWASRRSMVALVVATILGTLFNFFTVSNHVFRHAKAHLLWRFIAVYAVVFLCNAAGLLSFERLGFASALAQAILLPLMVVLSYVLNKRLVFGAARQV